MFFKGLIRKVPADNTQPDGIAVVWRSAFFPVLLLLAALVVSAWDNEVIEMIRSIFAASDSYKIICNSFITHFIGFGKGDVLVMLALLLGFCGLKQRAFAIICSLIIVSFLVWPFKIMVHRERPRGNSYVSFPSGDAASAASFAQVTATESLIIAPVSVVAVAFVSAGRVLGFAHYPSDVLVGAAFGVIAGIIGFGISKRYILTLGEKYFLLMLVAYVSVNELFCFIAKTHNGLSSFLEVYGPVVYTVITGRLIYLLVRKTLSVYAMIKPEAAQLVRQSEG